MKVLAFIILALLMTGAVALIGALPFYMGWNWGLVPAMPGLVKEIGLGTAFWLALFVSVCGGMFKTNIETKGD